MSGRSTGLRSVVASVIGLAMLLSIAFAISAFAEDRHLPNGAQVAEGIEQSLLEAEKIEQRLSGEQAVGERARSQVLYSDMPGSGAEDLLLREFGDWLEQFDSEPARFLSEHRPEAFRGQTSALVRVDGDVRLLETSIPVRTSTDDGLAKVDLSLVETGKGFVPSNPLVDLELPKRAGGAIEIGGHGLALTPVAVDDTQGQIVDDTYSAT
jgi:hypothetical protein